MQNKLNELKRSKEPKKAQFLLKMRPDLKLAIQNTARKQGRSMTNYILTVLAESIDWDGDI